MAAIWQKPAELDQYGTAGSPLVETVDDIVFRDIDGNVLDWSVASEWSGLVIAPVRGPTPIAPLAPTVSSLVEGSVTFAWSSDQTTAMFSSQVPHRWALRVVINGAGPFSLIAGLLVIGDPTETGPSIGSATFDDIPAGDDASVSLAVSVGVALPTIPTVDPHVDGQVWNDNGVLVVSSG